MPEPPNQNSPVRQTNQPQSQLINGMTVDQVAEMMTQVIRTLKEPSDEEKQKKAEETERKKEFARQAKMMAEQEVTQRMAMHQACIHRNAQRHTFVAQVTGDGNAVAICQICRKDYKWRATPDQISQGINLLEYAGLTEQHLLDWEKRFPPTGNQPPDRTKLLMRAGKAVA